APGTRWGAGHGFAGGAAYKQLADRQGDGGGGRSAGADHGITLRMKEHRAICTRPYTGLDTRSSYPSPLWPCSEIGGRRRECNGLPGLVLHSTGTAAVERLPVRWRSKWKSRPSQQLELQFVSWEHPFLPQQKCRWVVGRCL